MSIKCAVCTTEEFFGKINPLNAPEIRLWLVLISNSAINITNLEIKSSCIITEFVDDQVYSKFMAPSIFEIPNNKLSVFYNSTDWKCLNKILKSVFKALKKALLSSLTFVPKPDTHDIITNPNKKHINSHLNCCKQHRKKLMLYNDSWMYILYWKGPNEVLCLWASYMPLSELYEKNVLNPIFSSYDFSNCRKSNSCRLKPGNEEQGQKCVVKSEI